MKKHLIALMTYLVIFGVVTGVAITNIFSHTAIVELGLPAPATNTLIAVLGFLGMIKTLFYLHYFNK